VLAEIVRLASSAREQCFTWGPLQHQSTYDRIIDVAMRYTAVVYYARAVEIPLLPRHPASSSSSASTGFATDTFHPCRQLLVSDGVAAATGAGPAHLRAASVCSPRRRYFQLTLFSTNAHNYCVFVVILYSNRTGRPLLFPTAGPRQPETTTPTTPIFPLGGFRPPAFQFAAADIPSSSTLPMFQPAFDATTEDHLDWDQMGYDDILATLDAPQQAEEVVPSQLTQAPAGLSRHSQWAERPQRPAERHRRVERHWILQARRRRPWRHRLPTSSDRGWSEHLTPGRTIRTTTGLALELLGRRATDAFRCSSTFTMILYKLCASTR
jgi:hypothetical protein